MLQRWVLIIGVIALLAPPVSAELLGWWKLDEGGGNVFHDSSGHGYDGTIDPPNQANTRWTSDGYKGGALEKVHPGPGYSMCDVNIPDDILNIESATAAFWMNMPSTFQEWGIAFTFLGVIADHSIESAPERAILTSGHTDDGDGSNPWPEGYPGIFSNPNLIPVDEWHHVAVTYNADANSRVLYFDAVEANSADFTSSDDILAIRIGGPRDYGRAQWKNFLGKLDEVVVYDEPLTSEEVLNLYKFGPRPTPLASNPNPLAGTSDIPRDRVLAWEPGIYAAGHDVYFGTDFNDVNEATPGDPRGVLVSPGQPEAAYAPPGLLDYNQTYYWRVDEFNDVHPESPWKGDVWRFQAANFIVLDDFESYTDVDPNTIYKTWQDGWNDDNNGSVVGYPDPDFQAGEHYVETNHIHSGRQSMPFFYDNRQKIAEVSLPVPQGLTDWTRDGVASLRLWFQGYPRLVDGFVESPAGVYTVTGSGADIWSRSDQVHFVYKEMTGSTKIIARVERIDTLDGWPKAGVMIRESLEPDARYTSILMTPENGWRHQYRLTTNGETERYFDANYAAPHWLRLERASGGLARAYHSEDGNTWTRIMFMSVSMEAPVYVGLAVCSHSPDETAEAVFTDVTLEGTAMQEAWSSQDIGIQTNSVDSMYVMLNSNAVVYHDDPNATIQETWEQPWDVPLQAFSDQGVDLTAVHTLAIGVGTRGDMNQDGGEGLLFFDDIRLYRP